MKIKFTVLLILTYCVSIAQIRVDSKTSSVANIKFTNATADTISITSKKDTLKIGTQTNNTSFEADGTMIARGTATCFDDLQAPFTLGKQGNTNYPVFTADSSYFTFNVDSVPATGYVMYFTFQLPHTWKEGTTIYPHIHYKHENGVGSPNFIVKYKWFNNGSASGSFGWYRLDSYTTQADGKSAIAYKTTGISGAGKTISSLFTCMVYLRAAPDGVKAYTFDIHYEKNTLGSHTEYTK